MINVTKEMTKNFKVKAEVKTTVDSYDYFFNSIDQLFCCNLDTAIGIYTLFVLKG